MCQCFSDERSKALEVKETKNQILKYKLKPPIYTILPTFLGSKSESRASKNKNVIKNDKNNKKIFS